MDQNFAPPPEEAPKKKSNTGLIIAIVVIVVLCFCCTIGGVGYYLWQNGDELFNLTSKVLPLFI
ncbi:MAG: hypothetical protein JW908_13140 [Anaerolineales bacterium]|nr:hypothetical protein [Anaerolineales bacterium]